MLATFLIVSYSLVAILTVLLLTILVKYLKEKSDGKKSAKDKIQG
jgi:hypothetical protein